MQGETYLPFNTMGFFSTRIVVISYFSILLTGMLLLLTGYSFSSKVLNIATIAIIIIYPIIRFSSSRIRLWIKISISLFVVLFLVFALWDLPVLIAFAREKEQTIQTWNLGEKKVYLVQRQGWAGPSYREYDLKDFKIFGLIVKTIAYAYPSSLSNDVCKVEFNSDNHSAKPIYVFDACNGKLTHARSDGR